MTFKAAEKSTIGTSDKKLGFQIVVEINCPKCGVNVSPGCLIALNSKCEVRNGPYIDGYGLITPCCHMIVAMDQDFSQWLGYQHRSHKCQSEITSPYNEKGMVCDISGGVETVGLVTKTEADYNPVSGNIGP